MLPEQVLDIREYKRANGKFPFQEWRLRLDPGVRQRIDARLSRIRDGNLGDHKHLGEKLYELRLTFGPGYRIYFTRVGDLVIVLLAGGAKSSQARDIETARAYLDDLQAQLSPQ